MRNIFERVSPGLSTDTGSLLDRTLKKLVGAGRLLIIFALLSTFPLTASAEFSIDTMSTKITGLFWNPAESGWGVGLNQQSDIIFVTLYTYDENNQPKWYVVSNCAVVSDSCSGRLFEVNSGSALTDIWDASSKVTTDVGRLTLQFEDENNVSITGTLNGKNVARQLERQLFRSATPDAFMNALIWNESESGWGATLTQQQDITFMVIYTYDVNGFPVWYVASNCVVSGESCSGILYSVTGGTSLTQAWDGINKSVVEVGQVSLTLGNDDTGTLVFDIDGIDGNKVIARQIWAMDTDRDGVSDNNDNCPNAVNANQRDDDGDGTGNLCGSPLITTITSSGGSALSNDGKVSLDIPAGAVSSSTDILVTNNSDGDQIEYILEPSGLIFDQAVSLTHTLDMSELRTLVDSSGNTVNAGSAGELSFATLTSDDGAVEFLGLSSRYEDGKLITTTEITHFSRYKENKKEREDTSPPILSLEGGGAYPLGAIFSAALVADILELPKELGEETLVGLASIVPTSLRGTGAISPINDPEFIRSELRDTGHFELFTREFECAQIGNGVITSSASINIILDRLINERDVPRSFIFTDDVMCTGTPIVIESCTGVVHGTGQSTVNACVQYSNVAEGEIVRFSFSDGATSQEINVPVDENGKACLAATIFVFGQYSWQADLLDSSESGSIVVDSNNQACSLLND